MRQSRLASTLPCCYLIVAQVSQALGLQSLYIEANIEIQFRAIGLQYKKIASTDSFQSELE